MPTYNIYKQVIFQVFVLHFNNDCFCVVRQKSIMWVSTSRAQLFNTATHDDKVLIYYYLILLCMT